MRDVLIDPSVHGALGGDDGDDHGFEGSETREDMSGDCQEVQFKSNGRPS